MNAGLVDIARRWLDLARVHAGLDEHHEELREFAHEVDAFFRR